MSQVNTPLGAMSGKRCVPVGKVSFARMDTHPRFCYRGHVALEFHLQRVSGCVEDTYMRGFVRDLAIFFIREAVTRIFGILLKFILIITSCSAWERKTRAERKLSAQDGRELDLGIRISCRELANGRITPHS